MEEKKPKKSSLLSRSTEKLVNNSLYRKRTKETFCPECLSAINKSTTHWATCTSCGHQYCTVCKGSKTEKFHCLVRKVGVCACTFVLSPVLIVGGVVICVCSLVDSKIINKGQTNTSLQKIRRSMGDNAASIYCWLID